MRLSVSLVFEASLIFTPAFADAPDIHLDVPNNAKGLEVNVVEHDLAPGQSSGWHKHSGYEIAYVLSGAANVSIGASPIRHVEHGDTFEIERGTAHNVTNASSTAVAAFLITYLKDKNVPWKIPVQPPAIH
jgi:quercetin dioxygenase-like cupin family protein